MKKTITNKKFKHLQRLICIIIVLSLCFSSVISNNTLSLADESTPAYVGGLQDLTKENPTMTVGEYTFTFEEDKYFISKGNGAKKQTPFNYDAILGEKDAYYISDSKLSRYNYETGESSVVSTLPQNASDNGFYISVYYKGKIYITRSSFDKWEYRTLCYNTADGSVSTHIKGTITSVSGDYCIATMDYRTDVSPWRINLYKFTDSGLQKVKELAKYSMTSQFIDGKLYYTKYKSPECTKVNLCCANSDGSGNKVLGKIKAKKDSAVFILQIYSDYCIVLKNSKYFRYTYKTKKFVKIKAPK